MIKIPILTATFFDLRNFYLEFAGIKILKVGDKEFLDYCKKHLPFKGDSSPGSLIRSYIRNMTERGDEKYAIVPIEPSKKYLYSEIYRVFELLLIIYPSDLQIQHLLEYHGEDVGSTLSSWHHRYTGKYPGNYLHDGDDVLAVNEFIKRVFYRLEKKNFVKFIIDNYISSYEVSHFHLQYINLCICLEAVNESHIELNYRLRRTISILCAENSYVAELIFKNLKLIYDLRSKIVHGGGYDLKKVVDYLPFLQAIVSRTIMELLLHGIETPAELDFKITKLGFGDRSKLSENWKEYNINIVALNRANYSELKAK